jgi:hypothetical protein
MENEALARVTEFKRQLMRDFLAQCTEAQVDMFNRMYGSVEIIIEDTMD